MLGVVNMWLDACNRAAQIADLCVAVYAATGPAQTITILTSQILHVSQVIKCARFEVRPLDKVIHNFKVLSFKYTEFIEELYEVEKENIYYIYSCRRKIKILLS